MRYRHVLLRSTPSRLPSGPLRRVFNPSMSTVRSDMTPSLTGATCRDKPQRLALLGACQLSVVRSPLSSEYCRRDLPSCVDTPC